MHTRIPLMLGTCLAAATFAVGCGGSASDTSSDVTLKFAATAGDHAVECGHMLMGMGTTNASAQLMDMRLYISDVKLIPADGGAPVSLALGADDTYNSTTPDGAVTMLDFENGTGMCKEDGDAGTNTTIAGTVPAGEYDGVEFTVGVPEAMNHSDPTKAAAPLNLTATSWDWQAGRKFTKIELAGPMDGAGKWTEKAFMFHLGSTGCTGNPAAGETTTCAHPNRANVVLNGFDPDTNTIAIDLAKLVQNADITRNGGGAPGCMSAPDDPECEPTLAAMAIDWKADGTGSGQVVGDGTKQVVFSVM